MITIYASTRLENLCAKLAENISKAGERVFVKETIVTQSEGMNAWLKTELAKYNGVLANFHFTKQDGLLTQIYELLYSENPGINRDNVKYSIFTHLNSQKFRELFPKVAGYYGKNDLRRVQLAGKIADLFDQYQLYRSEMIESWENGDSLTQNPEEAWQKWLWGNLEVESRSKILFKIKAGLGSNKYEIEKQFPAISLFGITIFTKYHLDFLRALSDVTNINLYLCIPTDAIEYKNDLLLSFGNKTHELTQLVRSYLGDFDTEIIKNGNKTLLSALQNSISENNNPESFEYSDAVQINSCYTPARETECLYNYLLDLFEKDKLKADEYKKKGIKFTNPLKPGDILVLASDISKYAPFVRAVFKNGPVPIPLSISGEPNNSEDTVIAALEQLLCLTEDDLSSEKVVSLLEHKRISKKFGVRDCDYIRTIVKKANIRFGYENNVENETIYVSWKYGLEKILLGYAMYTDELFDDKCPFIETESADSHDLLRLKAFVDRLVAVIRKEESVRTLPEWKDFLFEEVIEALIYHDDFEKKDRAEISAIYKVLSFTEHLEFTDKVPFVIFLEELKKKLFKETAEFKLNTGAVTLAPPIPVRGVPYRIICFLGLDNEAFPGKDSFMGFDLLGEDYLEGDRDKKETDKYLFLDTIMAAREMLYMSYIGQNIKDNAELPPSIAIDILDDYTGTGKMVIRHPLHGFSSSYKANAENGMFTYLYSEAKAKFDPKEQEENNYEEIPNYSFVKFFENPVKWYFENVLGIRYDESEDKLPESELFELDYLQEWAIKQELVKMSEEEIPFFIEKGKREGYLPLKNMARICVEEWFMNLSDMRKRIIELAAGNSEEKVVVDLERNDVRITGTVDGIYGDKYISYAYSDNPKYIVRAYVNALLLYAAGKIRSAYFLYLKKQNGEYVLFEIPIDFIERQEAETKMDELLSYFFKGVKTPLKFSPKAAMNVIKGSKIKNIFITEADGDEYASLPPENCIRNLYYDGFFQKFELENFTASNFNREVYEEERFDEIKELAVLLKLKKD